MSRTKNGKKALPPVKVGSVSIPRYVLGDGRMMIAYPTADNPRKCQTFTDHAKGTAEAEKLARELHNGGSEAQIFSSADRADLAAAKKDVAPHCIPVHVATAEWDQAKRAIAGRYSLAEVVTAGLTVLTRTPHPVPVVVAELLASNGTKDLHGRYSEGIEATLTKFAEAFPGDIREVKAAQIARYLDGAKSEDGLVLTGGLRKRNADPVGPRRRDNILQEIRRLFQFARLHSYLPDVISEAKKVPLIDESSGEISFFTVAETRLILEHVREEWLPFAVLQLFNGFRNEELVRHHQATRRKDPLRWEDFDWEENEIVVREATSKVDEKRIPPIHEVTRLWLEPHRKTRGYIAPYDAATNTFKRSDKEFGKGGRLERAINRALQLAPRLRNEQPIQLELAAVTAPSEELLTSFTWHHNALRHSYGSYRASVLKNVNALAEEMGTSVQMIRKHYRNPRPASQARAYFAIRPPKDAIIVPFPSAKIA